MEKVGDLTVWDDFTALTQCTVKIGDFFFFFFCINLSVQMVYSYKLGLTQTCDTLQAGAILSFYVERP